MVLVLWVRACVCECLRNMPTSYAQCCCNFFVYLSSRIPVKIFLQCHVIKAGPAFKEVDEFSYLIRCPYLSSHLIRAVKLLVLIGSEHGRRTLRSDDTIEMLSRAIFRSCAQIRMCELERCHTTEFLWYFQQTVARNRPLVYSQATSLSSPPVACHKWLFDIHELLCHQVACDKLNVTCCPVYDQL